MPDEDGTGVADDEAGARGGVGDPGEETGRVVSPAVEHPDAGSPPTRTRAQDKALTRRSDPRSGDLSAADLGMLLTRMMSPPGTGLEVVRLEASQGEVSTNASHRKAGDPRLHDHNHDRERSGD
ncbi:hypothetical protein Pmi06nite_69460 [Planotetraspora mira]|uniref:Uncharacterized protein n=1 Tax=Planotetraspora mira TaxID=58121 RepID=A0A8J3TW51_9ACTN|nr:hypothetical protein Pmi06nite_69460 [Planotetraspora mira]